MYVDHEKVLYACGMEIPPLIISSPLLLEIVFHSDGILESTGFHAVYTPTGNTDLVTHVLIQGFKMLFFSLPMLSL